MIWSTTDDSKSGKEHLWRDGVDDARGKDNLRMLWSECGLTTFSNRLQPQAAISRCQRCERDGAGQWRAAQHLPQSGRE